MENSQEEYSVSLVFRKNIFCRVLSSSLRVFPCLLYVGAVIEGMRDTWSGMLQDWVI